MPSLLARINQTFSRSRAVAVRDDETRYSVDQWMSDYQQSFNYNGTQYLTGTGSYSRMAFGDAVAEISSTLPAYAAAMRAAPPAFAAQMVRALIISQARFTFRGRAQAKNPKRTFGTRALSILEQPGPGLTTGKMLSRMEWHAGLAGNAFVYRQAGKRPGDPPRLRVLRPDWTAVLWGSNAEPEDAPFALDNELLGYVYWNGGYGRNKPWTMLPSEVAHFAPIPDVENAGLGMSWVTPAIRDMQGDRAATDHKLMFFKNGATPALMVKGITGANGQPLTKDQFDAVVDMMESRHAGLGNAYRTLYLTAGADASVIGADLKQIDFKSVQGGGETRVSFLSRVPAALLGISEGLAGSSLNAGNFGMARRIFADSWVYPSLQDLAGSLATIVDVPADAELWTDVSDMPILREDSKDQAEILQTQAAAISSLINAGYTPESVVAAIQTGDLSQLKHTGLYSVQLQPPGNGQVPGAGGVPVGPDGTTPTGPAAGAGAPPVDPSLVETVPPEDAAARTRARGAGGRDAQARPKSARDNAETSDDSGRTRSAALPAVDHDDIARAKQALAEVDAATASPAERSAVPDETAAAGPAVAPSPGLTGQQWRDVVRAMTPRTAAADTEPTALAEAALAEPTAADDRTAVAEPVEADGVIAEARQLILDEARDAVATDGPDAIADSAADAAATEAADPAGLSDVIGDARRAVLTEARDAVAATETAALTTAALRALGETELGDGDEADGDEGELDEGDLDEDSLALLTALAELSDDGTGERLLDGTRDWTPAQSDLHPRGPGGKFRTTIDRIKAAIAKHADGDGEGDPLKDFNREQLRKVAKARGIELKRGEHEDSIKKKLLDDLGTPKSEPKAAAKAERKPKADAPKPADKPKKPATAKKPTDSMSPSDEVDALEGQAALDSVPVKVRIKSGANSSSDTWRATGFDGLAKPDADAVAAVTEYLRRPMFTNKRLRSPSEPLHEQSIEELQGWEPIDQAKAAEAASRADRHIAALDRVMGESRLPEPIVTWRGVSLEALGDVKDDATGHVWMDPGYSSTSTERKVAEHSFSGSSSALLRITTPSGTPALHLGGLGESEVLLGRGQTFRVTADRGRAPNGARLLDVEIVDADKPHVAEPKLAEAASATGRAAAAADSTEARALRVLDSAAEPEDMYQQARFGVAVELTAGEIRSLLPPDRWSDELRAAGHDTTVGHDELHHYWTKDPEGLAKWKFSPKPWTTLVKHLASKVGLVKARIFASRWFIETFHYAAGSDKNRVAHGHPPRGKKVGPG